jgi:hypothetical protein
VDLYIELVLTLFLTCTREMRGAVPVLVLMDVNLGMDHVRFLGLKLDDELGRGFDWFWSNVELSARMEYIGGFGLLGSWKCSFV